MTRNLTSEQRLERARRDRAYFRNARERALDETQTCAALAGYCAFAWLFIMGMRRAHSEAELCWLLEKLIAVGGLAALVMLAARWVCENQAVRDRRDGQARRQESRVTERVIALAHQGGFDNALATVRAAEAALTESQPDAW
ncbi:MAG: hypothetical protein QM770_07595 [Tepidisphaeraceae bacterium]